MTKGEGEDSAFNDSFLDQIRLCDSETWLVEMFKAVPARVRDFPSAVDAM